MFPWLIWLCMAGTAKGSVPSRLPSGAYILLRELRAFISTIRPSDYLRCVCNPPFVVRHTTATLFRGHRRFSPVVMTSLYCMNRSLTPPWQGGLAFSPLPVLPSAVPERIGPWFKVPFRSSILSLQPHFPRFTVLVTDYRTGFVAGGAAHTFPDGISTRLYVMPFPGRTWCLAPLSFTLEECFDLVIGSCSRI